MVSKRKDLMAEIENNMASRNLGEPIEQKAVPVTQEVTEETLKVTSVADSMTKRYKNTVVSIRFDDGDYEALKTIALEQGTNAAALVRKAVKEIIARERS
jgi:CHASE3 domain sensor protein